MRRWERLSIHNVSSSLRRPNERFSDCCRFKEAKNSTIPATAIRVPMTVRIAAMVLNFIITATEDLNIVNFQCNPLVLIFKTQRQTGPPINPYATIFTRFALFLSNIRKLHAEYDPLRHEPC
jgi:hypothetical protein